MKDVMFPGVSLRSTEVPTGERNPAPDHLDGSDDELLHIAGAAIFLMSFVVPSILMRNGIDSRVRVAMIIQWAMIESTAIFGLLAAFIGNDARLFAPLGALAVAGMLMAYPSDERLSSPYIGSQ